MDVDGLKAINDVNGHAAGDRMLVEVADTLRMKLRPYDLIIRYGGDEFVCVLTDMDALSAAARFDQVNTALSQATEHGSITAGVVNFRPGESVSSLIARADAALYEDRRVHRST